MLWPPMTAPSSERSLRHATAIAVCRWKDAAAVIENLDYTDRGECR